MITEIETELNMSEIAYNFQSDPYYKYNRELKSS